MSNPDDDSKSEIKTEKVNAPTAVDIENQTPEPTPPAARSGRLSNITQRWRREDILKRGSLFFRGLGFFFSVLAFIIMVTNRHGDWRNFDRYEEYRYVLAIAILSTLYTGLQLFRQINELSSGRVMFSWPYLPKIDFFGDQILAYLLMSAASSAVPLTNRMREGADNLFTDSSATALTMEFFAFFALALSALFSGYKLSAQTYI